MIMSMESAHADAKKKDLAKFWGRSARSYKSLPRIREYSSNEESEKGEDDQ